MMWAKLFFLISVIYLMETAILGTPLRCRFNTNTYPYIGTMTPYFYIYNTTEEPMTLTNCKPMQIWMLNRHGTRYPNENRMGRIMNITNRMRPKFQNLIKKIYGNATNTCIPLYANIKNNWEICPEFAVGKGLHVARQGEKDMESLGERIKTKLMTLFDKNVTKSFKFRSTATKQTVDSMISFIKGIFNVNFKIQSTDNEPFLFHKLNIQENVTVARNSYGNNDTLLNVEVVPIVNDTLLKLHHICEAWNNIINREVEAFINGPEMTKVLNDVTRRVRASSSYKIVSLLYDTCRFERTICPDIRSAMCDVFTDDEMRVLEYLCDLSFYYDAGPGNAINSQLGCHLIRDMFERFTKLEMDGDEKSGVFYFAHSHMISLFLTALGIGKNSVPLTARNFRDLSNRNWRISRLVPFAANVAAVFHRCNSSDAPFKVVFYLNEHPLILEDCENGICDWAQLKEKLGAIAANCSTNVCRKN